MDAHYTPDSIARQLVASAHRLRPRIIADFTAGEGSLLSVAVKKWPKAEIVATDRDARVVAMLRSTNPSWLVGRCDFLNRRSRLACGALRGVAGRVNLALLNPPFSGRGGARIELVYRGQLVSCSPAMAFLLVSLEHLAVSGQARAILPAGALTNEKDAEAWALVEARYSWSVVARTGRWEFPDCASSTALVTIRPRETAVPRTSATRGGAKRSATIRASLLRGGFQMHWELGSSAGPTLVHSTDLRKSKVHLNGRRGRGSFSTVSSPAVLIPRVGRPSIEKLALFAGAKLIMPSDCVFAIVPRSPANAERIHSMMCASIERLRALYNGTGAPFLTKRRLADFLESMGVILDD